MQFICTPLYQVLVRVFYLGSLRSMSHLSEWLSGVVLTQICVTISDSTSRMEILFFIIVKNYILQLGSLEQHLIIRRRIFHSHRHNFLAALSQVCCHPRKDQLIIWDCSAKSSGNGMPSGGTVRHLLIFAGLEEFLVLCTRLRISLRIWSQIEHD